jgi:hypothetical protein
MSTMIQGFPHRPTGMELLLNLKVYKIKKGKRNDKKGKKESISFMTSQTGYSL